MHARFTRLLYIHRGSVSFNSIPAKLLSNNCYVTNTLFFSGIRLLIVELCSSNRKSAPSQILLKILQYELLLVLDKP